MKPRDALRAVQDLASSQWGLLTTPQARSLGVTAAQLARFAEHGALVRLQHGLYVVAGVPFDRHRSLQAAWLALDPRVPAYERINTPGVPVVSHASAAELHGLGDIEADVLEFTVSSRKQSRREDVRIHRGHVPKTDWTQTAGLPVTTPARTVADLAAAGIDGGHLAVVARDAITTAGVSMEQLGRRLAPFAAKYGSPSGDGNALLKRFLDEAGIPAVSEQLANNRVQEIMDQLAGHAARQLSPQAND
jgi:predicted transcriptional regulator of viral defense system